MNVSKKRGGRGQRGAADADRECRHPRNVREARRAELAGLRELEGRAAPPRSSGDDIAGGGRGQRRLTYHDNFVAINRAMDVAAAGFQLMNPVSQRVQ